MYFLRESLVPYMLSSFSEFGDASSTSPQKEVSNLLGLCSLPKFLSPNFTIHLSHQIFYLMHGALNVDK